MIPKIKITVEISVSDTLENTWKTWTSPEDIMIWNTASADWHTTKVENNLIVGGDFLYRMEAKDGSFGFDFTGIYDNIIHQKQINYTMGDGRTSSITFTAHENEINIIQTFEAETENTIELQQNGWQQIMNNFKKHIESMR